MFERMRVLIAGEDYIGVLQQLHTDHVAQGVVLLVDGVNGGIWNLSDVKGELLRFSFR